MPLRSVVTLGNFTVSSHLSAQANTSTLRFIAEDCSLFLSEKAPAKSGIPSSAPVDLKKDYVNVVELGLFELSIRTNDKVLYLIYYIETYNSTLAYTYFRILELILILI